MRQITNDFPFLPAGCNLQLDPVAQRIVLDSVRNAIPSTWRDKCGELRSLGDVSLAEYLEQTGLDLENIYAGNHSWTEMRRAAQLPTVVPGPEEANCCASSADCVTSMTRADSCLSLSCGSRRAP